MKKKIGVLGLWHLGCVYAGCLAKQGFDVTGFDLKKTVVENLSMGTPPIFEPGLEELTKQSLNKNLHFASDPELAIAGKDYIFITLDIPVNNRDQVQMRSFYKQVELVEKYAVSHTVIVVCSQVPVGTCRELRRKASVIYFPENLRLGQAIKNFLEPDRIVLGSNNEKVIDKFLADFKFFKCPVLKMNLESAEMAKHALNSYLATMISFSSEVSDLCELTGANAVDVTRALKSDPRVSVNAPLLPGLGFAGGTLGRDLQTVKMISRKVGYNPKLIKSVYQINQDRLPYLLKKLEKILGSLKGKEIGLLGLTYKPGTNTLRRSQSLELSKMVEKRGANVRVTDPAINEPKYNEFFSGLDAVILMTPWEEFKKLNPQDFSAKMKQKIVFDARNFLDKELFQKNGFKYVGIG